VPLFDSEGNTWGPEVDQGYYGAETYCRGLQESGRRYRTAIENSSDGSSWQKKGAILRKQEVLDIFGFDNAYQGWAGPWIFWCTLMIVKGHR